jgi:LysM repeat protein
MTHTVKSGETLSKIARSYKITLGQLLDANPGFKADPDHVCVGEVLNIPGRDGDANGPAPTTRPTRPANQTTTTRPTRPQPQPQPSAGYVLGQLSAKYETGGRGPGVVSTGAGDAGGASYGSYQMTSKPAGGTVKRFVSQPDFPFAAELRGYAPGGAEFTAAWKQCAKAYPVEFQAAQHEYIKRTHFDPLVRKIMTEDGLNVLAHSHALQDVIWSTAVQHGPNNNIPHRALACVRLKPEDRGFDRAFIEAIYAERGRRKPDGGLVYFGRNSPAVQRGVANRFRDELQDALRMLAAEGR